MDRVSRVGGSLSITRCREAENREGRSGCTCCEPVTLLSVASRLLYRGGSALSRISRDTRGIGVGNGRATRARKRVC